MMSSRASIAPDILRLRALAKNHMFIEGSIQLCMYARFM